MGRLTIVTGLILALLTSALSLMLLLSTPQDHPGRHAATLGILACAGSIALIGAGTGLLVAASTEPEAALRRHVRVLEWCARLTAVLAVVGASALMIVVPAAWLHVALGLVICLQPVVVAWGLARLTHRRLDPTPLGRPDGLPRL